MLFIDLENLKIIKDYHYETVVQTIDFDFENQSLKTCSDGIIDDIEKMIKHSPLAISYEIRINSDEGIATDQEADDFLSAVNAIMMVFFANLITNDGRKREHRLDVPSRLTPVKISRLALKRAINQKTINDVFNVTITYKDLIYKLCDEKEMKGESDD